MLVESEFRKLLSEVSLYCMLIALLFPWTHFKSVLWLIYFAVLHHMLVIQWISRPFLFFHNQFFSYHCHSYTTRLLC